MESIPDRRNPVAGTLAASGERLETDLRSHPLDILPENGILLTPLPRDR
jgi:hypothetical protein